MRVLYDGWSLVRDPVGPEALHLLAILANLPDEISPVVALPEPPPAWLKEIQPLIHPVPFSIFGRLRWEQFTLPRLARHENLSLLHLTSPTAPILGDLDVLLSPSRFGGGSEINLGESNASSILERLRRSLAQGGMVRVKEILWPVDLPAPQLPGQLVRLSPVLTPGFDSAQVLETGGTGTPTEDLIKRMDLPEEFIIYHGPGDEGSLEQLMRAWTWAATAIGENYPLIVIGLNSSARTRLTTLAGDYELSDSIRILRNVMPSLLPLLYRMTSAVFHPAPVSPWSGPVRLALACGKPLVASEDDFTDAIAGPAAYLAPAGDARALGAALVTVIVEDQVAERLSAAAIRRAANWEINKFSAQLGGVYRRILQINQDIN